MPPLFPWYLCGALSAFCPLLHVHRRTCTCTSARLGILLATWISPAKGNNPNTVEDQHPFSNRRERLPWSEPPPWEQLGDPLDSRVTLTLFSYLEAESHEESVIFTPCFHSSFRLLFIISKWNNLPDKNASLVRQLPSIAGLECSSVKFKAPTAAGMQHEAQINL